MCSVYRVQYGLWIIQKLINDNGFYGIDPYSAFRRVEVNTLHSENVWR